MRVELLQQVNNSDLLENCSFEAVVDANDLIVSLKDKDGNDPSPTSPVRVAFRSATLTNPNYEILEVTNALTITIPNGATLGQRNGVASDIYPLLVNNGGTVDIGVTRIKFPEDALYTTIAVGTGSDLSYEIYANGAYTSKAIRIIGLFTNTQATAGVWATAPSKEISAKRSLLPAQIIPILVAANGGQTVNHDTVADIQWNSITSDPLSLYNSSTYTIYQPVTGCEIVSYALYAYSANTLFNGTTEIAQIYLIDTVGTRGLSNDFPSSANTDKFLDVCSTWTGIRANTLKVQAYQASNSNIALVPSIGSNRWYTTITIP